MPTIIANDPQYGTVYQDQEGCYIYDAGIATPFPCVVSSLPATKILTNQGGVAISSGQTTLDKILSTTLSLAALAKGAAYVPTSVQPQTYQALNNPLGASNTNREVASQYAQNNALGTAEAWVKAHPIPVAIGVIVGIAYFMPSPRQRR